MIKFQKEDTVLYLDVYTYKHDRMTIYKACKSLYSVEYDLLLFCGTGQYCYHKGNGWGSIGSNLFSEGLSWNEVIDIVTLDIL